MQNLSLISGPLDDRRFEAVLVPSRVLIEPLRAQTGYRGPISVVPGFLEPEWIRPPRCFVRGEPEILLVDREGKHEGQPLRVGAALVAAGWRVSTVRPPLTRSDFVANFERADVYVHLSYPEGFPVSILEAFGAGCLVVGFAGLGGEEFMRDGENCYTTPDERWRPAVERVNALLRGPRAELDAVLRRARETAVSMVEARSRAAVCQAFASAPEPVG